VQGKEAAKSSGDAVLVVCIHMTQNSSVLFLTILSVGQRIKCIIFNS